MTHLHIDVYSLNTEFTSVNFRRMNNVCQSMTAVLATFKGNHIQDVRMEMSVWGRMASPPDFGNDAHVWNNEHYTIQLQVKNSQLTDAMLNELIQRINDQVSAPAY